MPPRAERQQTTWLPPDTMNIHFRDGDDGECQLSRFIKLFNRAICSTRYADETCLRQLGLQRSVSLTLYRLDLSYFCALHNLHQTDPRVLISFEYYTPLKSHGTIGMVKFRMFNREYEKTQYQIADMLHFPHGDKILCETPLEGEWEVGVFQFWRDLTGETTVGSEKLKSTFIHNPTIRYVHRILANTIFGRANNHKVNSKKTFFIHIALTQTHANETHSCKLMYKLSAPRKMAQFDLEDLSPPYPRL